MYASIRILFAGLMAISVVLSDAAPRPGATGGKYYPAEVFLPSHADTAVLSALGFKQFEFQGRSVSSVKYRALVPETTDPVQIAPQITVMPLAELAEPPEVNPLDLTTPGTERKAITSSETSVSAAPVVMSGGPGYEWIRWARDMGMSEHELRDVREGRHPKFHRDPRTGEIHVRRTPALTGTFRTQPVEDGPFHKPENVGTADPNLTGTFRVTPYSTMRRYGLGSTEIFHADPLPGGTFSGVPNYQPRDEWRGVGYKRMPYDSSGRYRSGIQTPDGRKRRR